MKRSFALLLPLVALFVVASASVRGDDKQPAAAPAASSVVLGITAKHKDKLRPWQVPQYFLVTAFSQWGFAVESRVQTAWDAKFPKTVKVVLPAKAGDKAAAPGPATFSIEGTIEYIAKDVKFYDTPVDLINFVADVNVVVKDAQGKELKKISWKNYYGNNKEVGEEAVLKESEERATRFLTVDLFSIKEIADTIPKEKKEDFEKFLAKEKEQRDKHFDDFDTHVVKEKPDEKK